VDKYLYLISEFFVLLGFAATVLKYQNARLRLRLSKELFAFNAPIVALLVAGVVVPFVSQSLGTSRLVHLCMIFLAPFFVIGVVAFCEVMGRIITTRLIAYDKVLGYISVFLAIFLLFNSGVVFQVAHDSPTSLALNSTLDGPVFNNMELAGAKWIDHNNGTAQQPILFDQYRWLLMASISQRVIQKYPPGADLASLRGGSYLYFGTINVEQNTLLCIVSRTAVKEYQYFNATPAISNRSLIYTSGGCQIYFS
jgi:uncharacterized membrane protein